MFKILKNLVANDMDITFGTIGRTGIRARLPKLTATASNKSKTMYDNSFSMMGPRLWNKIPKEITLADTLPIFKIQLKKFLHRLPDKPPIEGYPRLNDNSIVNFVTY